MKKSEKTFHKTIEHIDSLKISKKDKDELLNNIADLIYEISDFVLEKQASLEQRVDSIEKFLSEDIDAENVETMIKCPYCNEEVSITIDSQNMDMKCPNCNSLIELEWSYDKKDCNNNCNGNCSGGCCKK